MGYLINILGAERTGSTLLDVMLGNGSNVFSCGEVSFYFRPMRRHDFILDCSCGQNSCPIWSEIGKWKQDEFHSKLLERYDFVIDSSKNLVWVIDSLENLKKPNKVVNLVTWKTPKNILYSHWKRGADLRKFYKKYVEYYKNILSVGLPIYSINHDDLINEPIKVLKRIDEITGVNYYEGKERFWEHQNYHFLFGSYGVRQQVRMGQSNIYHEKIDEQYEQFYELNKAKILDVADSIHVLDEISRNSIFIENYKKESLNIYKPLWYYYKKLGRSILKYFPRDYEIKDVNPIYGKK